MYGLPNSVCVVPAIPMSSKRHSLQAVELSQWTHAAVQIVSNLPAPSNGGPIYFFRLPCFHTQNGYPRSHKLIIYIIIVNYIIHHVYETIVFTLI